MELQLSYRWNPMYILGGANDWVKQDPFCSSACGLLLLETVTRGLMMELQLSYRWNPMYILGGASGGQTVTYC